MRSLKCFLVVLAATAFICPFLEPVVANDSLYVSSQKEFKKELEAAFKSKGPDYRPRTRHLNPDGTPKFINKLIFEDSPYLLQHAHNPVDWYPWGNEAFEKAKKEDKPIFLSIGYSTCHWCHVMEEECFENLEIARFLNEHYVCIKVDREQHPDIDTIYMTALMILNGRGGWPMSSFLTPDGKPFYAGTYFPPEHFLGLIKQINYSWHTQKAKILQQAEAVSKALHEILSGSVQKQKLSPDVFHRCLTIFESIHDNRFGGFGAAPKFPSESNYLFIADHYYRERYSSCLEILTKDLDIIGRSGLHDQVGGGFHRYSTDEQWLIPHFEKMLYNQANMARVYNKAYEISHNEYFGWIAQKTLNYVLEEMRSPEGGFYSATDADSEGKEGLYFTWTPEEIDKALNKEDAQFAKEIYSVTESGNFEGRNVLHISSPLSFYLETQNISLSELLQRLDKINSLLKQARAKRVPPLRDEKIIAAWNGMMITALAEGYEVFGNKAFKQGAIKAAEYIWQTGYAEGKGLKRIIFKGRPAIQGMLKDYAWLGEAFLSLYDITHEKKWLKRSEILAAQMVQRFWDKEKGGFFMSDQTQRKRMVTTIPKDNMEGATPSGNAVALNFFVMLADRTGDAKYKFKAQEMLNSFAAEINNQPASFPYMLIGAAKALHGEVGSKQYGARGKVMAKARWTNHDSIKITLFIDKGFHIYANNQSGQDIIPAKLTLSPASKKEWSIKDVAYPKPLIKKGLLQKEIAFYQKQITILVKISKKDKQNPLVKGPELIFSFQVCSEKECLAPQELKLQLGLPK